MAKRKTKTSYQRELAKLKVEKAKSLKSRAQLLERQKEMEEVKKIKRDIAKLKGAGTKRAVMKRVGKKIGSDAGRVGWKGLKVASKFVKNVVEAEAREQDRERARVAAQRRPIKKTPTKRRKRR